MKYFVPVVSPSTQRNRASLRGMLASLLCLSLTLAFTSISVSAKTPRKTAAPKVVKPTVINISDVEVPKDGDNRIISTEIDGKNFGKAITADVVKVTLVNVVTGDKATGVATVTTDNMIIAATEVPRGDGGPSRWLLNLEINGKAVDTLNHQIKLANMRAAAPTTREIEVTQTEYASSVEPTLHTLIVKPKSPNDTFGSDPAKMTVSVLPPGASKVTIEPGVAPRKMVVTFSAPETFQTKELFVTTTDTTDASGAPVEAQTAQPSSVKINRVDVLSLQRRDGFGRIKIEGEGFGDYARPPMDVDQELICDKQYRANHVDERYDTTNPDKLKEGFDDDVPNTSSFCSAAPPTFIDNQKWRNKLADQLKVVIIPRNPDYRVERTIVMYADDKVIDVYFEFSRWLGFSEPFRLDGVTVSVAKPIEESDSTNAHHAKLPTGTTPSVATFSTSHDIGPPRDANLEYRYTVLDAKDASKLFGSGVGDNFYVIELSVVNKGDKKVIVPLSSIQAEIEWSYLPDDESTKTGYDEGPATLSPLPLSAISSYFDAFQKSKGRKAKISNILDGVVTLSTSLVPVFGRNIERPGSILAGGFIPGLKKAWGDLSSQQLQNLTSQSWEGVEEIPAGGHANKFVYIQRSSQEFSNEKSRWKIVKEIKTIAGIEVSGFVVKESTQATATRQE